MYDYPNIKCKFAPRQNNYADMKSKNNRLDAIKMIISSKEVGSQEELLQELLKEGLLNLCGLSEKRYP